MTKTEDIFKTNDCPYQNRYQGTEPRVTFVCSAGLLRSPTAARIASEYGINARSAGSEPHLALVPLSANLIRWSHLVVFINKDNYDSFCYYADDLTLERLEGKVRIWEIEDDYEYMNKELVEKIRDNLKSLFN